MRLPLRNKDLMQLAIILLAERLLDDAVNRVHEAKEVGDTEVERHWLTVIAGIMVLLGIREEDFGGKEKS